MNITSTENVPTPVNSIRGRGRPKITKISSDVTQKQINNFSTSENTISLSEKKSNHKSKITKYFRYDRLSIGGCEDGTGIDARNNRYVQWCNKDVVATNPERYELFTILRRKDISDQNAENIGQMSNYSPESPVTRGDLVAMWMPLDLYYELKKEIESNKSKYVNDIRLLKTGQSISDGVKVENVRFEEQRLSYKS